MAHDTLEQLEAAREENIRLEADIARLERENEALRTCTSVTREVLAELIWRTSRADESTISVTGANVIADAVIAAGYTRQFDTPTHWANGMPRLLTPAAYDLLTGVTAIRTATND